VTQHGGAAVVGVIGGGQLARMMAQAAISLGVELRVFAACGAGPRVDCAAAVVRQVSVGDPGDAEAVARFAADCDVITFDHEQVPDHTLDRLASDGAVMRPGPAPLLFARDKVALRKVLTDLGLPGPKWTVLDAGRADVGEQLADVGARIGWPLVFKLSRGGYDGRGVWVVADQETARQLVADVPLGRDQQWLVEQRVPFERELAAVAVRSASGEIRAYPVVETVQTHGMCNEVVAPARGLNPSLAVEGRHLAETIAEEAGVVGVLAVELFEADGRLLVNELAMRPHNSGHWTMDGAATSQFENHLRAVLDWPLGECGRRDPVTVMVNVVGGPTPVDSRVVGRALATDPGAKIHLYGKEARPGRKLGHVNVSGEDPAEVRGRARRMAGLLAGDDPPGCDTITGS